MKFLIVISLSKIRHRDWTYTRHVIIQISLLTGAAVNITGHWVNYQQD